MPSVAIRRTTQEAVGGRFLQTDPIRYGDGPNIYAYVHGDPVNGTDPSGEVLVVNVFDSFGPGVVGHVGININNTNTIGFYPTTPAGWSSVTGTPGVWKQDDMSLPHTTYYINTTPAQDGELAGLLTAARYDPAQYSLLHCNCTTEVESLLAQVGVPTSAGSDNIPLVSNALFQSLELNYRGGCVACGGVRNRSLITLAARVLALAGPYIPADYVSGSGNTVICAACSYIYQAPPSTPQSPTPTIIPGDVFPDSPAGGDSGGGNCGGGGGGGGGPPTQDSGCVRPASYNIDRSSNPVPGSRKEVRLPAAGRPLDANWRPNPDRLYLRRLVA